MNYHNGAFFGREGIDSDHFLPFYGAAALRFVLFLWGQGKGLLHRETGHTSRRSLPKHNVFIFSFLCQPYICKLTSPIYLV